MKKAIYSLVIAVVTLVAMAFTEETQIMTINMADGTAIEYPIDSIANVGFKVYQGYAYDTSWLDKVYANPEYDALNDNEWYDDIIITEDGDTMAISMCRPNYMLMDAIWRNNVTWEEIEWYENEDGSIRKSLNTYTISYVSGEIFHQIYKNGAKTEFGIMFSNGHREAIKVYLRHIPSSQVVAMYDFLNWGTYNPDEYPHIPPYTTYKGFEIMANGTTNKFSFTENITNESWCRLAGSESAEGFSPGATYRNGNGELRNVPIGLMEGPFGRLPIIDHRKQMPNRVQVVKLQAGNTSFGYPNIVVMKYQHPNYDELVKDAVRPEPIEQ